MEEKVITYKEKAAAGATVAARSEKERFIRSKFSIAQVKAPVKHRRVSWR